MLTAVALGSLVILAAFTTAISQVAKAQLDAHGNKRPAQVLATRVVVMQ
jgi:hypothetical protein